MSKILFYRILEKTAAAWRNRSTHPGSGLSAKKRSAVVRKAKKGKDVAGGGFEKVQASAAKQYGSEEKGRQVAAAAMWKKLSKKK